MACPPDKQEKATQTVLEQAEVLSGEWAMPKKQPCRAQGVLLQFMASFRKSGSCASCRSVAWLLR